MADNNPKYQLSIFSKSRTSQVVVRTDDKAEIDDLQLWATETIDALNKEEELARNMNEATNFAQSLDTPVDTDSPRCAQCGEPTVLKSGTSKKSGKDWKANVCVNKHFNWISSWSK